MYDAFILIKPQTMMQLYTYASVLSILDAKGDVVSGFCKIRSPRKSGLY